MTRLVDRGAITAAWVGVGMAVTIGVSFLLVIPIEPLYWWLALPAGLLIGYYANQRSDRRSGPWPRVIANAAVAGLVTGLTMAALLLAVKTLFFFADSGYPNFNRVDRAGTPIPPFCDPGPDCVYSRYVAADRGPALAASGATDTASFTRFYWEQQFATAGLVLVLTATGGLGGGLLYGAFGPKARPAGRRAAA